MTSRNTTPQRAHPSSGLSTAYSRRSSTQHAAGIRTTGHVCDPRVLVTIDAIRQQCRPCPSCRSPTTRTEVRAVMWCVMHFGTGIIDTSVAKGALHSYITWQGYPDPRAAVLVLLCSSSIVLVLWCYSCSSYNKVECVVLCSSCLLWCYSCWSYNKV